MKHPRTSIARVVIALSLVTNRMGRWSHGGRIFYLADRPNRNER